MPEAMKASQEEQSAYDKMFNSVVGSSEAADPTPAPAAAPAPEVVKTKEKAPVESTASENPLIFGKYKTMEDATKGHKELESFVAGVKEFRELEKKLKDPNTQQEAFETLKSKYGLATPAPAPEEKKPEPEEITDLSAFDDDDIITGSDLKKALPALIASVVAQTVEKTGKTPQMEQVMKIVQPMVERQHVEAIKSRGGVFALYENPDLAAIRNQIIEADETGKEGRDVHAHYAALGKLIDDAVREEGAQLPDLLASLVQKKNAQPETASGEVTTRRVETAPLSEEDQDQANYNKMFEIVDGR